MGGKNTEKRTRTQAAPRRKEGDHGVGGKRLPHPIHPLLKCIVSTSVLPWIGQGAPIYETGGNYIHTFVHTNIHAYIHAYIRW